MCPKHQKLIFIFILIPGFILLCGCKEANTSETALGKAVWEVYRDNPIIRYGQKIPNVLWNDPSVIRENGIYRMWLSGGGKENDIIVVKAYEAVSKDGVNWDIKPEPVLTPGTHGQWDDGRIETPVVIKVDSTYHMYYSGSTKKEDETGIYNIGHATSIDGTNWRKDPNNPVIIHTSDPFHWGLYTVAEPGVIYKEGKFYLYYCSMKLRPGYIEIPDLGNMQGICLAFSNDGSSFTNYDPDNDGFRDAVLTQSTAYRVSDKYIGYSTPYAFVDSEGLVHLFYDVVQYPNPGDWRQVALAHAVSRDGKQFREIERNIIKLGDEHWLHHEVRAPCVIQDEGTLKMWYAGHTDWLTSGVGYAVLVSPHSKYE